MEECQARCGSSTWYVPPVFIVVIVNLEIHRAMYGIDLSFLKVCCLAALHLESILQVYLASLTQAVSSISAF